MKKRILSMLLAIVMVVGLLPGFAMTASAATITPVQPSGSGTASDSYKISTAAELYWFANEVNTGNNNIYGELTTNIDLNPGIQFTFIPDTGLVEVKKDNSFVCYLGSGILGDSSASNTTFDTTASTAGYVYTDASSIEYTTDIPDSINLWKPIGNYNDSYSGNGVEYEFIGHFDGKNYSISGLFSNKFQHSGLFGIMGTDADDDCSIKNVSVVNSYVCNRVAYTGGICGSLTKGTISGCSNAALICGANHTGGVVGSVSSGTVVDNCSNSGTVYARNPSVGGICGFLNPAEIKNCYNTGDIYCTSTEINTSTGGICGTSQGTSATSIATIFNCYNTGNVTALGRWVGGICGRNSTYATISQCYNTGEITAKSRVSGVSGHSDGITIENCYNIGTITATTEEAGGICGFLNQGTITKGHNYGNISAPSNAGSICGYLNTSSNAITNTYYLPATATLGVGNKSSDTTGYAETRTAEEFADGTVYNLLQGANSESVWGQTIGTNDYPVFYNGSNVPKPPHTHSWTYTASGAIITAVCGNADCPIGSETLTISAPQHSKYGDGKDANATLSATKIGDITVSDTDIVYTKGDEPLTAAPTDAGVYKVSITVDTNKTAYVEYTIAKADAATPTGLTAVYGQKLSDVTPPDGWSWVTPADSVGEVGNQPHKANYAGDDNHNAASDVEVAITVDQANIAYATVAEIQDQAYDNGKAIKPEPVLTFNNKTLVKDTDYTLTYSDNTNLGTATIKITGKGNFTGAKTVTFKIVNHTHVWIYALNEASDTITATCSGTIGTCSAANNTATITLKKPARTTYGGIESERATITVAPAGAMTAVPNVQYKTKSGTALTEIPTNAGTYIASITIENVTAEVEYTIEKAPIGFASIRVTAPEAGALPQATVDGGTGYSAEIEWNCNTGAFGYNTAYTATVTLTADSNHKFASTLVVEGWSVDVNTDGTTATLTKTFDATRKAKLNDLTGAPKNQTLTGYHTAVSGAIAELPTAVTYTTESDNVTVSIEWSCSNYDSATKATNTFTWSVKDGELNDYDVNGKAIIGSITVTNVDALPVTNKGNNAEITYDGNTYDVSTMFTKDENAGEASYAIADGGTGAGTLDGSVLTITKAGTIKITMSTAANGAYAAGEATATLTVNKADAAVTKAPTANTLTYTGSAQALVTAGEAKGGTMVYSLTEDGTYTETIPTGIGADTYTVYYKVEGNSNHNDTKAKFVTVTIAKAELTATISGSVTKVYDKTNTVPAGHDLSIALSTPITGNDVAASATYTYNGMNVGTTKINATGITLSGTDAGNYKLTNSTASADVGEITKATAPAIAWPTASSLVYGQKLSASTLTDEDENGTFAWQDGSTVPNVTNSGFVVVYTPKDTVNYDYTGVELTKAITVAVSKKTVTITVENKRICVEKEQPALTYTVSGLLDGDALLTKPKLTTNAVMTTAGDYTITASDADAGNNYTVTYQNGTLTVADHTPGASATHSSSQKCTVCNYVITPARGHNYSSEWKTDGANHWHECSCGVKKDTTAHTFTEAVKDEAKKSDADCLNAAVYYKSCSVCGFIGNDTFTSGEANGHSFTDYDSDNNATCTTKATETAKCDHCDVTDTRTVADSTTGHSFTSYVSDENATCTADGTKTAKCDRCDAIDTVTDTGSAKGHSFADYKSDNNASCTADGTKTAKCYNCDVTDTKTDTDSKLAHTFEKGKCTVCGAEASEYTNLMWLWIIILIIVLGGGGFALYWFVIRKKKEQS